MHPISFIITLPLFKVLAILTNSGKFILFQAVTMLVFGSLLSFVLYFICANVCYSSESVVQLVT